MMWLWLHMDNPQKYLPHVVFKNIKKSKDVPLKTAFYVSLKKSDKSLFIWHTKGDLIYAIQLLTTTSSIYATHTILFKSTIV